MGPSVEAPGRWVKVRSWMLFDVEHLNEAENTAPGRGNWRATAWEIHPVASVEVVEAADKPTNSETR